MCLIGVRRVYSVGVIAQMGPNFVGLDKLDLGLICALVERELRTEPLEYAL